MKFRMTRTAPLTKLTGVAAAAGVLLLASCTTTGTTASTTLEQVKADKTITVAFAAEEPYGFLEGGELVGEAPALHGEIFDRIGGVELDGVQYDFNSLIPALNAGDVDVVSAGMFITPERCEQAIFSDPEYIAKTAFLVRPGNPENLNDFSSVASQEDVRLAVMRGAVSADQAKAAGIPDSQTEVVADQAAGVDALLSGRADVFVLTDISLHWVAKGREDLEVTESFVPVVDGEEQIGIGAAVFRKEDTELRDAFNHQLDAVLKDGDTWLKLVEDYGFTEANKPDPNMSADEFCKE